MPELRAGEIFSRVVPTPMVPFCLLHASSAQAAAHVAVHHRMAALQPKTAATHVQGCAHTAVKSATAARIRIVPREQNTGDADSNNSCDRSEQHGGSIPHVVNVNTDADEHCPAAARQLRRLRRTNSRDG